MVGPPQDRSEDEALVQRLLAFDGQKVVCGGTTSKIVSRVTGKELEIQLDYISPEVPPVAKLEGIDLVTEGIITMQHALELIRAYAHDEPGRDQVLCQGAGRRASFGAMSGAKQHEHYVYGGACAKPGV